MEGIQSSCGLQIKLIKTGRFVHKDNQPSQNKHAAVLFLSSPLNQSKTRVTGFEMLEFISVRICRQKNCDKLIKKIQLFGFIQISMYIKNKP